MDRADRDLPPRLLGYQRARRSAQGSALPLIIVSIILAVPALFGSFIILGCAFSYAEIGGGKGQAGCVVPALLVSIVACLGGFLPFYLGLRSLARAKLLKLYAADWAACPDCGWSGEVPISLAVELPRLEQLD